MQEQIKIVQAIEAINTTAKEARRICTDIVRQTSFEPYYRKRGAAAAFGMQDISKGQHNALALALQHLQTANMLLCSVAMNGAAAETLKDMAHKEDYYINCMRVEEHDDGTTTTQNIAIPKHNNV